MKLKIQYFNTPAVSILIVAVVQIVCIFVPFSILVEIMNVFYCSVIIILSLSFLNLRRKGMSENLERGFKAANTPATLLLVGFLPISISLLMIVLSVWKSFIPLLIAASFALFLFVIFIIKNNFCRRELRI